MSFEAREKYKGKLYFWKHVTENITPFDHRVFCKSSEELIAESSNISAHDLKHEKNIDIKISPKFTPFIQETSEGHTVSNLNDFKLRHCTVDLSHSKYCLKECDSKNSRKFEHCLGKNNESLKNLTFFKQFKLKPLTVFLADCVTNNATIETKSEPKIRDLEKHKLYADFKPSCVCDKSFTNKDLFCSIHQNLSLEEVKLHKTLKKAEIKLHSIEETVAFCKSLNLQPTWKNSELSRPKYPLKQKKRQRFS